MKKLEVQEYAELVGKSKTAIYNSIKDNKLKYIVETINGRDVKMVLIEDEEYEELLIPNTLNQVEKQASYNLNQHIESGLNSNQIVNESPVVMELITQLKDSQKYFVEYNHKVSDLHNKLVVYAELAGQAKLLMDSEHSTKEEYFKLQQENRQLRDEQVALKVKLEQLQENFKKSDEESTQQKELEMLKKKLSEVENQKTFWDVLFKKV
ncbi:MAG: hypothetical protein AB7V50_09515 [Vampirovibrionia bacterium]